MSLIHWWPLNGNCKDQGIGSPIDLAAASAYSYIAAKTGQGITLSNSVTNQVTLSELNGKHSNFTISMWVRLNSGSAFTIYNDLFTLWLNDNSQLRLEISSSTGASATTSTICLFGNDHYTDSSGARSISVDLNKWIHLTYVVDDNYIDSYLDGVRKQHYGYTAAGYTNYTLNGKFRLGDTSGMYCSYCDIRIYDHALSAKEVKEISKGLVLHYTFEDNYQQLINAYNEPTFNTSAAAGGWNHWGPTGNAGSYAQNTDNTYIYPGFSTYSHKVANGSGATANYLLYQERTFDGGYRSMQAIIKASDGAAITNSICYPAWNGRDGGIATRSWTSIEALGNGFYLCKVEGIKQTTSPSSANAHLVGIYVTAGKTIYVTCCYLENGKQLCSDIFDQTPKCYDSSGYSNNGIVNGDPQLSTDSASGKYSLNLVNSYIKTPAPNYPECTIAFWIKRNSLTGTRQFIYTGWPGISIELTTGNGWQVYYTKDSSYNTVSIPVNTNLAADTWYHCVFVISKNGNASYINGSQTGTSSYIAPYYSSNDFRLGSYSSYVNFNAKISDFKIFATALSETDIKAEYNRKAAVDKNGNLFTGEFIEQNSEELLPGTQVSSSGNVYRQSGDASRLTQDTDGSMVFTNTVWTMTPKFSVKAGETLYWDITYSNTTNNQFYVGFEFFDDNGNSGSNELCYYVISGDTAARDHYRVKGTLTVRSTVENGNAVTKARLRVLNAWNGSSAAKIAKIHHISLRRVSTLTTAKVDKSNFVVASGFREDKNYTKTQLYKNGFVGAKELIEN